MSGFKYRFSVIPAGAITDARLVEAPRALQVLCLIGRHIDDFGWCRRSQVQMAKELKCARSTVQAALDLLYETGWLERRLEGRGKRAPDPAGKPFAAHSYRVILDRDEVAGRMAEVAAPAPETTPEGGVPDQPAPPGGCPTDRQGVPDQPAPLEGISSEGKEREARARGPDFERRWRRLFETYPGAAGDDIDRARLLFADLPDADQAEAAGVGLDRFVTWHAGRSKREKRPFLQDYLRNRIWTLPEVIAAGAGEGQAEEDSFADRSVPIFSRSWWCLVWAYARAAADNPRARQVLQRKISSSLSLGAWVLADQAERARVDAAAEKLVQRPPDDHAVAEARARFLREHGVQLPMPEKPGVWVWLPAEALDEASGPQEAAE